MDYFSHNKSCIYHIKNEENYAQYFDFRPLKYTYKDIIFLFYYNKLWL